ncbi:MAG: SRPBCC domain-containing protein [Promethearchaeota archaeon]
MIKKKRIEQKILINASPHEIYEIFMDSKKHSKLTESKVTISRKVGGKFSVWEGEISGKNVALIEDKKIVQTWKSDGEDWGKSRYSTITLMLEPKDKGTEINFTQEEIPESAFENVKKGWTTYYWEPLKEMFG